jgi:hypothetical protein
MNLLEEKVLVLNRLWQAINVCSAKRAICFLYTGHAKVVESKNGNYELYDFSKWLEHSQNNFFSGNIPDEEAHSNGFIHSISCSLKKPNIIILGFYLGYPNLRIKLSRENIYKRDKYTCQYCGKKLDQKKLNIDHILPRHRGGKTTWTNVVTCCFGCNLKKGGKILSETDMKLLQKPRAPLRYPLQNLHIETQEHKSWTHFIDFNKWEVEIGEDDIRHIAEGNKQGTENRENLASVN